MTQAIVKTIAQRFVERAEELGMKGKKRDEAALEYFVGAMVCAESVGNTQLANRLHSISVFNVAVRGYVGVAEITHGKA